MKNDPYKKAGVDINAGNELVQQIKGSIKNTFNNNVLTDLGGFAGLFSLPKDIKNPTLVACTDGVGTKVSLALANNSLHTIGQDLVGMCVNDLITCGAKPLFFLDYFATSKLNVKQARIIIESIANACKSSNCVLLGGETAEMPGHYVNDNFDLAGFCVGIVDETKIIDGKSVAEHDLIIGIDSSGAHSNGYSLIRKILDHESDADKQKWIEHALQPTYLYPNLIDELKNSINIKSIANITGGGLVENIPRSIPKHLAAEIFYSKWKLPEFFQWLQTSGNLSDTDMQTIFNCGIGLTIVIAPNEINNLQKVMEDRDIKAHVIGKIINQKDNQNIFFK